MIDQTPTGSRLCGFYRGLVILHLTHGYCKIWIPGVYPEEWKDMPSYLPPAEQASSLFGGTNNGSGEFTYPNIGSIVWCFFANEDLNNPVYFASSLGGQNAFGQYELVKNVDEDVSLRHLLTSGKSRVEIYENGKISAIVEDPDRRDAEVKYDNSYIQLISDDHVIQYPTQLSVDKNLIPHVNCLIVADVSSNNGEISSSTNKYFIDVSSVNYISDDKTIAIVSSMEYTKKVNSIDKKNNDGVALRDLLSSDQSSTKYNCTNTTAQETTTIIENDERKAKNYRFLNLDGIVSAEFGNKSGKTTMFNYLKMNGENIEKVVVSSFNSNKKNWFENLSSTNDGIISGVMSKQDDFDLKYSYTSITNPTESINQIITQSHENLLSFDIDLEGFKTGFKTSINDLSTDVRKGNGQEDITIKFTNKHNKYNGLENRISCGCFLLHQDQYLKKEQEQGVTYYQYLHKLTSDLNIGLYENNKFLILCLSDFYKKEIFDKIEKTLEIKYLSSISSQFGDDISLNSFFLKKVDNSLKNDASTLIKINSTSKNNTGLSVMSKNNMTMIEFLGYIDTVNGIVFIGIADSKGGNSSILQLDSSGQIQLTSSTSIDILSKNISITGSLVKISGGSGDCKIKNVSLLSHKHIEMQSGDVVKGGSTKTLSAQSSN